MPWYRWDNNGGLLTIYTDSSARISGRVFHPDNVAQQWDVDIWLRDGKDYAAWTALGRGKIESAPRSVAANQQDWLFWKSIASEAASQVCQDLLRWRHLLHFP